MGARGELGVSIELDLVPQRETGMTSYEIMLSESQERMLLVADKGREQEVLDVFKKWGLDASIVGIVTADDVMRVHHHGELVAEIPNKALTDEAPVYRRPVGTWTAPVPKDPPAHVLEELRKPRDYTADLKRLLASANICDKRWVFEQYDSMVQTNTVQGPGGEAGVMRIKGTGHPAMHTSPSFSTMLPGAVGFSPFEGEMTDVVEAAKPERGLAMALAGNGRWCYLDPKLGAMHAVAEAARKVACTGATPVAATNCLNFGNPEKPEIMAQLSAAIDGITEACIAFGTPVTGGNVSLYNETKGEGIYPTPVLGIVGILDDVEKAVPAHFQRAGRSVYLLSGIDGVGRNAQQDIGSTEYARLATGELWGTPQPLNLAREAALHRSLAALAAESLIESACDISDGGSFVTFAEAGFRNNLGIRIDMKVRSTEPLDLKEFLFSEIPSSVIVTADPADLERIQAMLKEFEGIWISPIGTTQPETYSVTFNGQPIIETTISELKAPWAAALESQLAAEVIG